MHSFLKTYGILSLSLVSLFGTGVLVGRLTQLRQAPAPASLAKVAQDAGAWIDTASRGLVGDLKLDSNQESKVREHLSPVATAIFSDQERALFQMHLRLLEVHDTLSRERLLSHAQQQRLSVSRAKLRELIIHKFPKMVRENPALTLTQR